MRPVPGPLPAPIAPAPRPDAGFNNFAANTDFLKTVLNPHLPEPNTGVHVPMWLSPKLAREVMARHGHTGHAIPHPNIDLKRLDK